MSDDLYECYMLYIFRHVNDIDYLYGFDFEVVTLKKRPAENSDSILREDFIRHGKLFIATDFLTAILYNFEYDAHNHPRQ